MQPYLTTLAKSVTGAESLEAMTRALLELLEMVTGLETTYLTRIDERAGVQHILFSRNSGTLTIPEGLSVPWSDTLCKRALEEGRAYTDNVAGCWGDSQAARELGLVTYLSEPVRGLDGSVHGTLCGASNERKPVSEDGIRVLKLFANLIAYQLERERTMTELRAQALADPLTGIANRRALLLELERGLARRQRDGGPLLVAFIDLDDFKAFNDAYGHDFGDRVLITMAQRLQYGLRASDFLARVGGDEFVVVTTDSGDPDDLAKKLAMLSRGRIQVDSVEIDYDGASVGAVAAKDGEDAEQLLDRADTAMYAAKRRRQSKA